MYENHGNQTFTIIKIKIKHKSQFLFNRSKVKGTNRAYRGRSLRESNRSIEHLGELDTRTAVIILSSSKQSQTTEG